MDAATELFEQMRVENENLRDLDLAERPGCAVEASLAWVVAKAAKAICFEIRRASHRADRRHVRSGRRHGE